MSHPHNPLMPRVADAGFDSFELAVLAISRLFFQSFAVPDSQAWTRSYGEAYEVFSDQQASQINASVLATVQAMRMSRRSGFSFSSPDCENCCQLLSENERQFMAAITAARRGQRSALHANAMVLCEGNDAALFVSAVHDLSHLLATAPPQEMNLIH